MNLKSYTPFAGLKRTNFSALSPEQLYAIGTYLMTDVSTDYASVKAKHKLFNAFYTPDTLTRSQAYKKDAIALRAVRNAMSAGHDFHPSHTDGWSDAAKQEVFLAKVQR